MDHVKGLGNLIRTKDIVKGVGDPIQTKDIFDFIYSHGYIANPSYDDAGTDNDAMSTR